MSTAIVFWVIFSLRAIGLTPSISATAALSRISAANGAFMDRRSCVGMSVRTISRRERCLRWAYVPSLCPHVRMRHHHQLSQQLDSDLQRHKPVTASCIKTHEMGIAMIVCVGK